LLAEGKNEETDKIVAEILEEKPQDLLTHWFLVNRSLKRKDFRATAELLTKIQTELGIELNDLTELPAYAEFVQSPEYANWVNTLPKRC
jgi:hypothetical protein